MNETQRFLLSVRSVCAIWTLFFCILILLCVEWKSHFFCESLSLYPYKPILFFFIIIMVKWAKWPFCCQPNTITYYKIGCARCPHHKYKIVLTILVSDVSIPQIQNDSLQYYLQTVFNWYFSKEPRLKNNRIANLTNFIRSNCKKEPLFAIKNNFFLNLFWILFKSDSLKIIQFWKWSVFSN